MILRCSIILLMTLLSLNLNANLLVSPTRIIFDERERVKEVILINTSNVKRTYRLEWSEKTTSNTGSYIDMEDAAPNFALSPFIRFSPRQVTLAPGERQIVKLLLRRNNQMPLDEYRSHLRFSALPSEEEMTGDEVTGAIEMRLNVLTSFSIPVMLRIREVNPEITIESIEVVQNTAKKADIRVTMLKSSSNSVTGQLNVFFQAAGESGEKQVGVLNSATMFHETERYQGRVVWQDFQPNVKGKLRVEYAGGSEYMNELFDKKTIEISL